jgi:hypothetical protein
VLYQLSYASGFVPCSFSTATGETLASVSLPATVTLRAGDGTRTRDIKLGRLALYQLSYSRTVSCNYHKKIHPYFHMVGEGFEPS